MTNRELHKVRELLSRAADEANSAELATFERVPDIAIARHHAANAIDALQQVQSIIYRSDGRNVAATGEES